MIRIFRVLVPLSVLALLCGDLILLALSFTVATSLEWDLNLFMFYESGALRISFTLATLFVSFYFQDFYESPRIRSHILFAQRICLAIGFAFMAQAVASYLNPDWMLPQRIMIIGSALAMVAVFAWHIVVDAAFKSLAASQQMIFLGGSPPAFELARYLRTTPELGMTAIGYMDDAPGESNPDFPRLGPTTELMSILEEKKPEWIIIGRTGDLRSWWVDDFLELRFGGVRIEDVATLYEELFGRVCLSTIHPTEAIYSSELQPRSSLRLQFFCSFVIATIIVICTAPLLLGIAILIKIASPGPALLRLRMRGMNDQPFTMYRFRCTVLNSSGHLSSIGNLLCRFHLDGLPQLFNVLSGQMSMVGPRPQREEFAQRLGELVPLYSLRHRTTPGLISLADLYATSSTSRDSLRSLEYDLYYVKHNSLSLDVMILVRAVKAVFR